MYRKYAGSFRLKPAFLVLPPALTWHTLDTKSLFLIVFSVVSWISFY